MGDRVVEMSSCDAGVLVLPAGHIVACDPQFDLVQSAFAQPVEPGEYPVFLAIEYHDVALVMVQFREGQPDHWATLAPARFGVDSATGCLMDRKVARTLLRRSDAGKWDRSWKRIEDSFADNDGLWANVCMHRESGANIVAFRTWGGDGTFATYWGYAANGELLCSVTDMFLEFGVEENSQAT